MVEEILFESERTRDRAEIGDYLRTVADKLETGDPITLESGDGSTTLSVPSRPTFEVKAEREGSGSAAELSVEFEIEWDEGDGTDDELTIG